MKITCITISNNTTQSVEQNRIVNYLADQLQNKGLMLSSVHSITNTLDSLSRVINSLDEELLFVVGGNTGSFNKIIKDNICSLISEDLEISDRASTIIDDYVSKHSIVSEEIDYEKYFPTNSFPLIVEDSYLHGFLYRNDYHVIVYLPERLETVESIYIDHVDGILDQLYNIPDDRIILNLFGLPYTEIKGVVESIVTDSNIQFYITSNSLDSSIILTNNSKSSANIFQNTVATIIEKLKKHIYSTSYDNIYKVAQNMLQLSKRHIIIAETETKGTFTKHLLDSGNTLKLPLESRVYTSIDYIVDMYNIDKSLYQNNKINVKLVSEISAKLFENIKCDLLISIIGQYDKMEYHNVGYISICDEDGIHIYKNSISGNEEDIIEVLSKSAAFYLIKKIKENNLLF